MEITPDVKVGKLAFTLWGRPAFDGFVEAWPDGEYRRGVDEHLLAAEAAMREMERLDERLSDLIVAPPLGWETGILGGDGAADAAKTVYGRWLRYAVNEARSALDSAVYEVATALVGVVEDTIEVSFSKGRIAEMAKRHPHDAPRLRPVIEVMERAHRRDEFHQFDRLRQIGTHRRIPLIMASSKAHFVGDTPLSRPSMAMSLPKDMAAFPAGGARTDGCDRRAPGHRPRGADREPTLRGGGGGVRSYHRRAHRTGDEPTHRGLL